MRYLSKNIDSQVLAAGWQYPQDAAQIRAELLREQQQYYAYSEKFVGNIDSCDVEHFDPRLKKTENDGYWNWYAVLHWMNAHKPRHIEPFTPVLSPYDPSLRTRIRYEDGQFVAVAEEDSEARNLIRFLGWNRPELTLERSRHIARVRVLRTLLGEDETGFVEYLREHPEDMSFATALEAELGIGIPSA